MCLLLVFHREHGLQQAEEARPRLLDGSEPAQLQLGLLRDAEAKPAQPFLFKFPHRIPFVKHCYIY